MSCEHEFSLEDKQQAKREGLTEQDLHNQLHILRKGVSPACAARACVLGDGILSIEPKESEELLRLFNDAQSKGRFSKMVPASGAATRMFKFVFNAAKGESEDSADFKQLRKGLKLFPFYKDLAAKCPNGKPEELPSSELAKMILEGLNFQSLPKAFIPFHAYSDHVSTALDEHFKDSILYLKDENNCVRLHFTIDPQFVELLEEKVKAHTEQDHVNYQITHSIQKPSTQTIAMTDKQTAARTSSGELFFRPGGHGSLLVNIQDLDGDIVFLQNIDNVGREEMHPKRVHYKKLLGGLLLKIESQIAIYSADLKSGNYNLKEIWDFAKTYCGTCPTDQILARSEEEQVRLLLDLFKRPIRVCGMVKNEGEPGGGPFWTEGELQSCQILEKDQLDLENPTQASILEQATHFNPVDLVIGLKDANGKPHDLMQFRDPETCFISQKSIQGKTIYALEHPGLWNGSMANWNTTFVEVPLYTFSPVKTVNDLIRAAHQP
ncbi:MAG: hypothetical protein CR997_00395 [Acidobacteria bacterium]|nr:MAG: hypothetical protein CR997_00395 [Acidobacteriota bacterium]